MGCALILSFSRLKGLKLHGPPSGQHHELAGKGAAPWACFLFFNIEFTEMADYNVLTGFKSFFESSHKAIYGVSGLLLGESRTVGHGLNNIGFCEGHDANYFND